MEEEFLKILDRHQAILHKTCRLYRDTEADREDLFQEILYHLWKAYPSFQGKSKISTWIYRIALNTALATFRRNEPMLLFSAELPQRKMTVNEEGDEQLAQMLKAMKKLKEVDRAILSLYLDDMTYEQIAQIIGITSSNVGARLHRIKTKLKALLSKA
ncbi:MAG: sigma-70 family RNA polymerase sigma factor [Saprospiraceae bacterium]|nr:sigma-70 family RNA polymerase sigma factor [Saprospiraceae bacterium]